nr:hypothetical protein [Desulfobacula sp.]
MTCQRLELSIIILTCIFAAVSGCISLPATADTGCPDYIWIGCGEQTRVKNGAVTQRYYVRTDPDTCLNCTHGIDYQAFYQFQTSSKKQPYRFAPSLSKEDYYRVPIQCGRDGLYFDITAETNTRIELYVFGTQGSKRLSAKIVHALFGKAPSRESRDRGEVSRLPEDFPDLRLRPSPGIYYMQTGQAYGLDYTGAGAQAGTLSVLENGQHIEDLSVSPDGGFSYTPPHDPKLDRAGSYEFKETVALVKEITPEGDYITSHTLLLHRSYLGRLRLQPGLALFGATILVFAGITGYYRNKRNP